jgi:HPr kinase/phosphorylase
MRLHASCAAKNRSAVLLLGPSGAGKSDLLLRLIDRGFGLVADDQVEIADGMAAPPAGLAGLVEARGLGILRFPCVAPTRLCLAVRLQKGERLPSPCRYPALDLPLITLDPWPASAPYLIELALLCATDDPARPASFHEGALA